MLAIDGWSVDGLGPTEGALPMKSTASSAPRQQFNLLSIEVQILISPFTRPLNLAFALETYSTVRKK